MIAWILSAITINARCSATPSLLLPQSNASRCVCSCFWISLVFFAHFTSNLSKHAMMVAIIIPNAHWIYPFSQLLPFVAHPALHILWWWCFAAFCSFIFRRIILIESVWWRVWVSPLTFSLKNKRNEQKHVHVVDTLVTSIIECTILCSMRHNTLAPFPLLFSPVYCTTLLATVRIAVYTDESENMFCENMQTSRPSMGWFGPEHRKRNNLRQKNTRSCQITWEISIFGGIKYAS